MWIEFIAPIITCITALVGLLYDTGPNRNSSLRDILILFAVASTAAVFWQIIKQNRKADENQRKLNELLKMGTLDAVSSRDVSHTIERVLEQRQSFNSKPPKIHSRAGLRVRAYTVYTSEDEFQQGAYPIDSLFVTKAEFNTFALLDEKAREEEILRFIIDKLPMPRESALEHLSREAEYAARTTLIDFGQLVKQQRGQMIFGDASSFKTDPLRLLLPISPDRGPQHVVLNESTIEKLLSMRRCERHHLLFLSIREQLVQMGYKRLLPISWTGMAYL